MITPDVPGLGSTVQPQLLGNDITTVPPSVMIFVEGVRN